MTIRVLWVIKGLGPGGAETLLAAAADAHDRAAFEIECAYVLPQKDHLAERLERAGVRTHCVSRSRCDPAWPVRLRQLMVHGRFDVVHVHSPIPAAAARVAVSSIQRARRPRIVSTEHNAWNTYHLVTRWANRLTIFRDDAIFAVSEETRSSMSAGAAARSVVLHQGIDVRATAALSAERDDVRTELGLGADEFVIGTVANYRAQKDYPSLLRAASELKASGLGARVVAVGQGPLESEIVSMRGRLGLDDSVLLTGYRKDASRVMSAFDVFTLASTYEGLPVAMMEALAIGLPVVATRVGGVAEFLADRDAVLVPASDPSALAAGWRSVIESPSLRASLSERSAARSGDLDIRRAVATYESCYRRFGSSEAHADWIDPRPPRQARSPSGLDIRRATPDDRSRILELLIHTLGWTDDPRYAELFAWKHDRNPFGPSPMWVATDADRIVGLRAFMRWDFARGDEVLHAVRAVDTAIDPAYQGRGLFTAMTLQGLDALHDAGIDFVFNTPNDESRPGYLKMGWREVGHVPIAIRPRSARTFTRTARARVGAELFSLPLYVGRTADHTLTVIDSGADPSRSIATERTDAFLHWRYSDSPLDYRVVDDERALIVVRGRNRGAARELVVADVLRGTREHGDATAAEALRSSGFDHAVRCGTTNLSHGFAGVAAAGPRLVVRPVRALSVPPAANWALSLGDVELF